MSIGLLQRPTGPVKPMRWTKDEFYQMLDMGMFADKRVELLDGEIYQMPAQKNFHAAGIKLMEDALNAAFGPKFWVRVQMTLDLSPYSVPDPDLAVVKGTARSLARKGNPRSALLIVEVSDTTLWHDRNTKLSIYAAVGIEDYWIVNITSGELEVYRRPIPDSKLPYGFGYDEVKLLKPGDFIRPLALRGLELPLLM